MNTVLTTQGLSKQFGRINAVNGLDLEVSTGQVYGILGPNGSGKTTTLGMLLGVTHPSSGSYHWFGEPPSSDARKKIGAVLEHPIFYPYLTGEQNLRLAARIKNIDPINIDRALELVQLLDRKSDPYKTYSLGMKQRLAIASAMIGDPTVLILDEPTNGLDPMGIYDIRNLIIRISNEGTTIVLASHLLDEVQKVCTHFAVLKKGNKIYAGAVNDLSDESVTIEVKSHSENLLQTLNTFESVEHIKVENDLFTVTLKKTVSSVSLSKFLLDQQIAVTHFLVKKRSLEKHFMDILQQNETAGN